MLGLHFAVRLRDTVYGFHGTTVHFLHPVQDSDIYYMVTVASLKLCVCVGPLRPCWWGADYRATTHAAWLRAMCPHGSEKSTAPQTGRTGQQHGNSWGLIFSASNGGLRHGIISLSPTWILSELNEAKKAPFAKQKHLLRRLCSTEIALFRKSLYCWIYQIWYETRAMPWVNVDRQWTFNSLTKD